MELLTHIEFCVLIRINPGNFADGLKKFEDKIFETKVCLLKVKAFKLNLDFV